MMELAEALLRVPDAATRDDLIAEKIRAGGWGSSPTTSGSFLVNRAANALAWADRLVGSEDGGLAFSPNGKSRVVGALSRPPIRMAADRVMHLLGGQYVLGSTIQEALRRARASGRDGPRYSFDMLGEAARTRQAAERYFRDYSAAIQAVGDERAPQQPHQADGISVKLSALHPRYDYAHRDRVMAELLPRIRDLCRLASRYGIGLTIDAEEADRLELSLDIFEALADEAELADWHGLGIVVQAYGKRSPLVVDWLIQLSRETNRQIPVRLVKGAYWDTEIKRAQEAGHTDYPVFTRKANTDLCYEVCARKLLEAEEALYPQFATHNAYTIAVIRELAGDRGHCYEFQRLHGMGQLVYQALAGHCDNADIPLRIYAPVGPHRELLPYLVRRLLENGANSSFVNHFLDEDVPPEELTSDVRQAVMASAARRHARIPLPEDMLRQKGDLRRFTSGIDLANPDAIEGLSERIETVFATQWQTGAIIGGRTGTEGAAEIACPADRTRVVGTCRGADREDVDTALRLADGAYADWNAGGAHARAEVLERAACLLEGCMEELTGLLALEAGRTLADGVSEVREAADFLRYYASQARRSENGSTPGGTGTNEEHVSRLQGRGIFFCISPWNFPLAIFAGQISAALAAGNCVIAKPADQTPIVGSVAVRLLHEAGVPVDVLHFLPGDGPSLGRAILPDPRIQGVAFTGSTAVARAIWGQLAGREGEAPVLIAETGGQNCMVVDSSALPEQVVDDVVRSAFSSAGQRCSALRVLYLQDDIADDVLEMLKGAMAELTIGEPWRLSTDVGPVIDERARSRLRSHIERMKKEARFHFACDLPHSLPSGTYVAPHLFEISSIRQLEEEVFGPVLHVVRYERTQLHKVIEEINSTGYGLTMGVHSRIESFSGQIVNGTRAGNNYINRDMIGAVVGVHPFGGNGLSGTGPKAGGPHYLPRFARSERSASHADPPGGSESSPAQGGNQPALALTNQNPGPLGDIMTTAAFAQSKWDAVGGVRRATILEAIAERHEDQVDLAQACIHHARLIRSLFGQSQLMPGPAGEENRLSRHGLGIIACGYDGSRPLRDFLFRVTEALAFGNSVIACAEGVGDSRAVRALCAAFTAASLPTGLIQWASFVDVRLLILCDRRIAGLSWVGKPATAKNLELELARQTREIVPIVTTKQTQADRLRFAIERTITTNTTASGGDAVLLSLTD